jgi:CpXC motif protein
MSDIKPALVACPRCGAERSATLFTSLNADLIEAQHAAILDGSFERLECGACGHAFRPEHRLLYTQLSARTWIVLYPLAQWPAFRALEPAVASELDRELATAPPIVAQLLRGVRRRLVFGQHALTEAARVLAAGLDPALLECLKLVVARDHLGRLMAAGPFELCFERSGDERLVLGVHALAGGDRVDELDVPASALSDLRPLRPELSAQYPALFEGLYASATRYLFSALAR